MSKCHSKSKFSWSFNHAYPRASVENCVRRTRPGYLLSWVLLLCCLLVGFRQAALADESADRLASATLVIYNSTDPTSETLARFYAMKRSVPSDQVVGLPCVVAEEITREDFEISLERPLRDLFYRKRWWRIEDHPSQGLIATSNKIRFIALMRGIPARVLPRQLVPQGGPTPVPVPSGRPTPPPTPTPPPPAPMERQEAAVDSELAALGILSKPIAGPLANPYFKSYKPILDANLAPLILVCRLDGPNLMTVRNMILDSLTAESSGVGGVALVDTRNLHSGGYAQGDEWMRSAAADFRSHGIPTLMDERPETLPAGYPARNVGYYLGWYTEHVNGPFANPDFKFRKGAIAVHLHSFSGATLRNPTQYWCAPLLERGAAATLGNVYEPYLDLTPHLDVFADRLLAGFTFAEASYMSMKSLSWMTTAVGDPLYRPFASWSNLDKQDAQLEDGALWNNFRSAALKFLETADPGALAPPAHLKPEEAGLFLEGAAGLARKDNERGASIRLSEQAIKTYTASSDKARVAFHLAQDILVRDGKPAAISYLQKMMRTYEGTSYAPAFAAFERELNPPPPPPSPSPSPK